MASKQTPAKWAQVAKACDRLQDQTTDRIKRNYEAALTTALKRYAEFFQKYDDVMSGRKKPPEEYVNQGEDACKAWRQGYIRELMRQENVVSGIATVLNSAGAKVPEAIKDMLNEVYSENRREAIATFQDGSAVSGGISFSQYDKCQIDILLDENSSVFTKIAFSKAERNQNLAWKLQNELAQATILGESQDKVIKRIEKVTRYEYNRAKRIAQTERTRVQSQARYQAGEEAKDKGVRVYNEWSARLVNTRDTHKELNGKKVMQGQPFKIQLDGDELYYPGDPHGMAKNVINCYCVLIPHVLLPGEELDADGNIVKKPAEEAFADEVRRIAEESRYEDGHYDIGTYQQVGGLMKNQYSRVYDEMSAETRAELEKYTALRDEVKDYALGSQPRYGTPEYQAWKKDPVVVKYNMYENHVRALK